MGREQPAIDLPGEERAVEQQEGRPRAWGRTHGGQGRCRGGRNSQNLQEFQNGLTTANLRIAKVVARL